MARRRLGVALVLDRPVADEVDGLRRALGDPALGRIRPHITLVSPVNVRDADLPAALEVLRRAAAAVGGPLRLGLGAPTSFLPANPVVHLPVAGDLDGLARIHDALAAAPLGRDRPGAWPWVPHVTLVDGPPPDRLDAALVALRDYSALIEMDRLVLLEEGEDPPAAPASDGGGAGRASGGGGAGRASGGGGPGRASGGGGAGRVSGGGGPARASGAEGGRRRWVPLADAALGPPAVVGRGGLEVRLTAGRLVAPDLGAVVAAERDDDVPPAPAPGSAAGPVPDAGGGGAVPVVLTAHREGACVGGAALWWAGQEPTVAVVVAGGARRLGVGGTLLAHLEAAARAAGWSAPQLRGIGPPGFYAARSSWTVPGPA